MKLCLACWGNYFPRQLTVSENYFPKQPTVKSWWQTCRCIYVHSNSGFQWKNPSYWFSSIWHCLFLLVDMRSLMMKMFANLSAIPHPVRESNQVRHASICLRLLFSLGVCSDSNPQPLDHQTVLLTAPSAVPKRSVPFRKVCLVALCLISFFYFTFSIKLTGITVIPPLQTAPRPAGYKTRLSAIHFSRNF